MEMETYAALPPTPTPTGNPAAQGHNPSGIGVIVLIVALAVVATMWIRRAATRYRRRIHDQ
jgi:hypothetical protein